MNWDQTIDNLMRGVAQHNSACFKQLYQQTNPKLYALVLKMSVDPDLAADILQEAYTKVWLNAAKHNSELGSAWPWLCQLFRNTALDRLRQRQRQPLSLEDSQWIEASQNLNEHWQCDIDLKHCMAKLNPQPRQALLYAYVYGYSHRELAEQFQQPLGTLKSWIRRAMQELKLCLSA